MLHALYLTELSLGATLKIKPHKSQAAPAHPVTAIFIYSGRSIRTLFAGLGLLSSMLLPATPVALAPRSTAVLEAALVGEFALQGGDIPRAAERYARAAEHSTQPELIERAATIALYAKNYEAADTVGQRWLTLVPDAVGARRTLAWAALARGRVAAADVHLRELLALRTLDAQRAVAQVLIAAENRKDAPTELNALARTGNLVPMDTGPVWSAVASNLEQSTLAMELAEAETEQNPKSAEAWRRRAQAQLTAGKVDQARSSLRRAIKLQPKDFDLRLALAAILSQAGDIKGADKLLAQASQQDDRNFAARLANVASKQDRKVLAAIERALEKSKPDAVKTRAFLLGQLAELREDPDRALEWYGREPPGAAWHDAQLRRAVLLARERKDLSSARKLLGEVREQASEVDQRVDAWLLEAELVTPDSRVAALDVYDDGVAKLPDDSRLLYARALFRAGDNDVSGLEADLQRILSRDPENPQVLNALGYTLADRTDRTTEALGYIRRALALQPDDGAFVDSMGWVQFRLGNLKEALVYLRRAYELVPDGEVAAHLGEALWVAKKPDEARELWRAALKRWPENKALVESVRRLDPDFKP